jgi:hypothetical protein
VKLATHLYLVPTVRVNGPIRLFSLYALMAEAANFQNLYFLCGDGCVGIMLCIKRQRDPFYL